MGYRLRFDGVNDYCQFGSSMSIDLGLSAYTFEAKLILNATPASLGGLLGRNGTSSGFFITSTLSLAMYVTNTLRYQTSANFFLQDGNAHTYRLEHDAGGAWRAYRDGTLFQSGTFTSSTTAAPLIWIGQGNNSANSFCSMDLEYLEVTGVTNAQKWDANLSSGTGTTLPTTSGTNQATLINFPTDNSQWISFSSGAAYAGTLQAGAYTSAGSQLSSVVSYSSTLQTGSYSHSGSSLGSAIGYSSSLQSGSFSYSGSELQSIISNGAQNYTDTLLGGSFAHSGSVLQSAIARNSALLAGSYSHSGSNLTASLAFYSSLNGGSYSHFGSMLQSTVSGEVTVSIEGYTITFAADDISGAFAADTVAATFISDYVSATWSN